MAEPHSFLLGLTCALVATLAAQSPYSSSQDFAEHARMLRENALLKVDPQVFVPSTAPRTTRYAPSSGGSLFSRGAWKQNIVTTVFNVGEQPTKNNPTPNHSSSWDSNWESNYGGFDDPEPDAPPWFPAGGVHSRGKIRFIAPCPTTT